MVLLLSSGCCLCPVISVWFWSFCFCPVVVLSVCLSEYLSRLSFCICRWHTQDHTHDRFCFPLIHIVGTKCRNLQTTSMPASCQSEIDNSQTNWAGNYGQTRMICSWWNSGMWSNWNIRMLHSSWIDSTTTQKKSSRENEKTQVHTSELFIYRVHANSLQTTTLAQLPKKNGNRVARMA